MTRHIFEIYFEIFTNYLVAHDGFFVDGRIMIVLSGLRMKSVAGDVEMGGGRAYSKVQGKDSLG